jgi:hypothetical protein
MWTEFFDSELWSQTVLQLSHNEPAIKHGIMALSIMHERYEGASPLFTSSSQDFAFVQYMQAIKHSNQLLTAYQEGNTSLEMVLITCIIFTSYENLTGNYKAASMHLRNGLRILEQNRHRIGVRADISQGMVANSLYRMDLEAMSFSDNASPYNYVLDMAPVCPDVQDEYTNNDAARNDLVGILRCILWLSGVTDQNPKAPEQPVWLQVHQEMSSAMKKWESTFAKYQQNIPAHIRGSSKSYAGITLLKMASIMCRIIAGSGAGNATELAWDAYNESFKTIVDLAATIPIMQRPLQPRITASSSSSSSSSLGNPTSRAQGLRLLAPNPTTTSPTPSLTPSTFVFSHKTNFHTTQSSSSRSCNIPPNARPTPSHFSPSFELSPIIPLFVTACRCRDPIIRRRAISLLLSYRRREGVWDSLGAGMVAAQCMAKEEKLDPDQPLNYENVDGYLKRNPKVTSCADVPESARVRNILVRVKVVEGRVDLVYSMTTGEECAGEQVLYEARGHGGFA